MRGPGVYACVLVLLWMAGCAGNTATRPAAVDLSVKNFSFTPTEKSIANSAPVTWQVKNEDSVRHSLTQTFNFNLDKDLPPGETTTVSFTAPAGGGDYQVVCKYHGDMKLTVHVA